MAIGRISGPMLKANLLRQGVDLSVETDLLYVDVNNLRIGIKTDTPTVDFDIVGIVQFNNDLTINGTTISSSTVDGDINFNLNSTGTVNFSNLTENRIAIVGASGSIIDDANFTYNGTDFSVGVNSSFNTAQIGNLDFTANTIVSTNVDGNIILSTNGSGTVNITTLTENRIIYTGASGSIIDNSNLTFNGSELALIGSLSVDNLLFNGNTVSSTNLNGNINISPNGIGEVVADSLTVSDLTDNRIVISGAAGALEDNAGLTFDGTTFTVNNFSIENNTIANTVSGNNFTISTTGTGKIVLNTDKSVTIPVGNTVSRPTSVAPGDVRFNSDSSLIEFYDGTQWQNLSIEASVISNFETFSGNDVTTSFTLSTETTSTAIIVTLNGVVQSPGTAYSVSGTTLTFTEAPATGDDIEVRYIADSFNPGTIISDQNTLVQVDDSAGEIVSRVDNNIVVLTNATSTTFTGSIFGTGSLASITNLVPSSSTDTGTKGTVAYDNSYVYICVDTNTWIRTAIDSVF